MPRLKSIQRKKQEDIIVEYSRYLSDIRIVYITASPAVGTVDSTVSSSFDVAQYLSRQNLSLWGDDSDVHRWTPKPLKYIIHNLSIQIFESSDSHRKVLQSFIDEQVDGESAIAASVKLEERIIALKKEMNNNKWDGIATEKETHVLVSLLLDWLEQLVYSSIQKLPFLNVLEIFFSSTLMSAFQCCVPDFAERAYSPLRFNEGYT